jgi:two-component system, cell cycle response regulator CtrA
MNALTRDALLYSNAQLREENDFLREQIAFLTAALMGDDPLPLEWNLTDSEERLVRVLMARQFASKDTIMAALYWDKDEPGEIKIIDVMVCKIRKKLKRHGIDIRTHWGRGYSLPPEIRQGYRSTSTRGDLRGAPAAPMSEVA